MENSLRKEIDSCKEKYNACQLVRLIAAKYSGSEFLRDPIYIALTEDIELAEWRGREDASTKLKNNRIEREEIYDMDLCEDDEED